MSLRSPSLLVASLSLGLAVGAASPPPAQAFCGFFVAGSNKQLYNNASHVVLLRKGNRTVMTMSNNYKGPPEDFAMVVPVPVVLQKQQVRTPSSKVFNHIDELTAPRLVEYWEQDPCDPGGNIGYGSMGRRAVAKKAEASSMGGSAAEYHVKIEAQFEVGEYEILILSAEESGGLEAWLRLQKYNIPQGAAAALAPYIQDQMKFFVAKVNIQKVKRDSHGDVLLSPLQFSYDANELRLPVRLGLLNAESKQDLLVYVLHQTKRFEVANYPNVFIPTNLEVVDRTRQSFGAFYAELFDETLRRQNNRAVVTEYSWDTSSCDPCPTPPLEPGDLMTLGASRGDAGNASWVVTRLHTRYDRQTLNEDLIFRTARPAVGGRADRDDGGGSWKASVRSDETNNFQARYIVRHYWGRKAKCDAPEYNTWGGPPDGRGARPQAARDLANAARGQLELATLVKTKVPALGLNGLVKKSAPPAQPAQPGAPASPPAPQK